MILCDCKEKCCGCTACQNICPQTAIVMLPDEEGFLYPQINKKLCNECGLCKKVCTFQNGYETPRNYKKPFIKAVCHKDEKECLTSRSGAAFIALSDYILQHKGVVYGAGYSDHFRVIHKRALSKEERNEFKGSKYVQSDLGETFRQVKIDLQNSRVVLYSGTPCHTAGLCRYLEESKISTDYLYVCDIVCHGTPSPFIWRDYLAYIEKKYKHRIMSVNFRDKAWGWKSHVESFILQNTNRKVAKKTYADLFHQQIINRPCCEYCPYTNFRRPADITLADYWGVGRFFSEFDENKGVSLVLINTPKGQKLFDGVKQAVVCLESSEERCLQPSLQYPSKASLSRASFWKDYQKNGFLYVGEKYGNLSWWRQLYRNTIKKLGKVIKKFI